MTRVVILTITPAETQWAIDYLQKNRHQDIRILTPQATNQQMLASVGIYPFAYFDNPILTRDYYAQPLAKMISQAQTMYRDIKPAFKTICLEKIPLFDLLQIGLETEITTFIFAYKYLSTLEKTWQPDIYYLSSSLKHSLSGWSPHDFPLATFAGKYLLPKRRIRLYIPDPVRKSFSDTTGKNTNTIKSIGSILEQGKYLITNRLHSLFYSYQQSHPIEILIFSAGFNLAYYRYLLPMLLSHHSIQIVTGDQSLEHEYLLHRLRIPFIQLTKFWTKHDELKAQGLHVRLKVKINQVIAQLKINQPSIEKWPPPIKNAVVDTMQLVIHKNLLKQIKQVILAEKVVGQIKPQMIITTHDPAPSALPFVLAAKKRRIKTTVLLHGWNDISLGVDHRSDRIIVWGNYIKKWYIKKLHKGKNTVIVAGFPHLDDMWPHAFWKQAESSPFLPPQLVFGLLLTLYPPNTYPQSLFLTQLFEAAKEANFVGEFWLRTHSGQEASEIYPLGHYFGYNVKLNHIKSLEEFVMKCDVVLSWDTTAIYWPMILGKPLFYTTPLWGEGITPVREFKAAWLPKNSKDVFTMINKLRDKPERIKQLHYGQKKILKEVVGFYDDRASERTRKAIEQLLIK